MADNQSLPQNWHWERLGKYIDSTKNGYGRRPQGIEDGPIVLRLADVTQGYIDLSNTRRVAMTAEERATYGLNKGDVLFIRVNGSREFVGQCVLVNDNYDDVAFNDHLIRVRLKPGLLSEYLYRVMAFPPIRSRLLAFIPPTVGGQLTINQQNLANCEIPVPPLPEQHAIAAILGTWDKAIALTEGRIAVAEQRKKALMQRLLTGRVRFSEFRTSKWVTCRIRDLVKSVRRPIVWNDDETYNLISVKRRSGGLFLRQSLVGREIKTKQMNIARTGDFLISKMQVVHGAWALTPQEFDGMHISNSYMALVSRDSSKLDIRYFDWLSRMPFMYHLAYVSSSGVHIEKMSFDLQDFLKRKITVPGSVDEQKTMISLLNACDRELDLLRRKRDALQRQKKGLMQRLLTGQVRVKI
ncbi:MAG: restriction endonuclease subunit S [Anaerolineae bacterium]|nr:restriction endonuclease subunit S [Anaerolineae bacterium]